MFKTDDLAQQAVVPAQVIIMVRLNFELSHRSVIAISLQSAQLAHAFGFNLGGLIAPLHQLCIGCFWIGFNRISNCCLSPKPVAVLRGTCSGAIDNIDQPDKCNEAAADLRDDFAIAKQADNARCSGN